MNNRIGRPERARRYFG